MAKIHLHKYYKEETKQIVYLQEMVHIAPSLFYEHVNNNIFDYISFSKAQGKKDNIYIEGVKPLSKDENKTQEVYFNFIKTILSVFLEKRIDDNYMLSYLEKHNFLDKLNNLNIKDVYKKIAFNLKIDAQDEENYLKNINKEKIFIADMNLEDIIKIINKDYNEYLTLKDNSEKQLNEDDKKAEEIKKLLNLINSERRKPYNFILRMFIIRMIKNNIDNKNNVFSFLKRNRENRNFDILKNVILNKRNNHLINFIKNELIDENKNMFITYGKAHFNDKSLSNEENVDYQLKKLGFKKIDNQYNVFFNW